MSRTVISIENELAALLGAGSKAELASEDQTLLRSCVQRVLTSCFIPEDGHKPDWATRYASCHFPQPETATLALTKGSKAIGSGTPAGALAGARVLIGSDFYTYAGSNTLVGEWDGESGSFPATFYYFQVALPGDAAEVLADPQIPGIGPLYPLTGISEEMSLRAFWESDFKPFASRYQSLGYPRRTFNRARSYEIGDPWFYWVDSTATLPFADVGDDTPVFADIKRLSLYPLPDKALTVEMRISVNATITSDDHHIHMPADAINGIFLPLCYEAVAKTFPDYRGQNIQLLMDDGERARRRLKKLGRGQRDSGAYIRRANGW